MRNRIKNNLSNYGDLLGIFLVLLVLVLFFSLMSENFFTSSNLFRILLNVSTIGIMALGECLVIVIGGLDLAVASVFAISGILTGICITKLGINVPVSILIGLASGAAIGAVNATLILYVGLASFIATFGMLSVIRGLAYAISGGYTIPVYNQSFTGIGMGYLGPVPVPGIIFLVAVIALFIVLRKTTFGMRIYATGGNPQAAYYSGIKTTRTKFLVYVLSGVFAAAAGIVSSAKIGMASSTAGIGYELDVITAVILGGVSLKGGKGSVVGVLIGTVIMGVIRNGLLILNISAYYQTAIIGLIIIVLVLFDSLRNEGSMRLMARQAG